MDAECARQQAQHFRQLAPQISDEQVRAAALELAKQYEQKAEAIERGETGRSDEQAADQRRISTAPTRELLRTPSARGRCTGLPAKPRRQGSGFARHRRPARRRQ